MKRLFSVTAGALVVVTSLCACSSSTGEKDNATAQSSATTETSTGDSFTKPFTSTAPCTLSNGKTNEVVSDVKLEGGADKYTATFNFKDASASAANYETLEGRVVIVGQGGTSTNTISFAFENGNLAASKVEGLEASFADGKITVSQPFSTFDKAAELPLTWFADLTAGKDKVAQCGVFGDSVTVK